MNKLSNRAVVCDCVFLFAIVFFSALPYLFKLGFYSDDWPSQSILARFSNQGVGAMFRAIAASDSGIRVRPVQAAYLVLGFKIFGHQAMPYHVVNIVVLGLATILIYLVIREMPMGRWTAFVVALSFGVLPHYSSDRIWISAVQAPLCMAFALLGIYTLLRSVRPEEKYPKRWVILAIPSLVLSILSYEVAIGLIAACLLILAVREIASRRSGLRWIGGSGLAAVVLLVVGVIKIHYQTRIASSHGHFFARLGMRTEHAIIQAARFNFWTYGLKMPAVLFNLHRRSALSATAVASASIIAAAVATYLWKGMSLSDFPSRRTWLWLLAAGCVVYGLGFGLFFANDRLDFTGAGLANRVTIASALGTSCILAAGVGFACSLLKPHVSTLMYCGAIGAICGMNCLVMDGIGSYWVEAATQQRVVLSAVAKNVRTLPPGSVLLLDGFCRWIGPAAVFEYDWDSTGAIQLLMGDSSLSSDVMSPNLRLHDISIEDNIEGATEASYPYGDHLFIFNVPRQILVSLPSRKAANDYLRAINPTQDSGCPMGRIDTGTKVF
jgi:dolichyl-phosphate-mannose-protein mannosyltransferase